MARDRAVLGGAGVIFVGVDWAEAHLDVCVMDEEGRVLEQARVGHSVAGLGELHALACGHGGAGELVAAGIEIDRGLVVTALLAAGYQVFAVNPLAVSRYRERHSVSGAKSDRGDAKVLADLVRTDRHNHRLVAGDTDLADAVKILARAHQSAIWSRQRQVNALRSALREFYPAAVAAFGADLAGRDAAAVLAIAASPQEGRTLSEAKIARRAAASWAPAQHRPPGTRNPGRAARGLSAGPACGRGRLRRGGPLSGPAYHRLHRRDLRT